MEPASVGASSEHFWLSDVRWCWIESTSGSLAEAGFPFQASTSFFALSALAFSASRAVGAVVVAAVVVPTGVEPVCVVVLADDPQPARRAAAMSRRPSGLRTAPTYLTAEARDDWRCSASCTHVA